MQNKTIHYRFTASAFKWNISDEKIITAWGFNNRLPGPEIRAKKGDTVVVTVKNNLSEPTMVHWHGIRLPASMDGTSETQRPILPGEEFEYRFTVPDAGTFWYHSHHNETSQMERGMYGSLVVEDDSDPVMDGDRVLMIDDMKLDKQFQFRKEGFVGRWMERHDGREGSTLLINGKENTTIRIAAAQTERWRFINASSARYVRLSLGGRPFNVMATDGGLLGSYEEVKELLMVPGERYDIAAGPFNEGETFAIESLHYNRMTFVKSKDVRLATVKVGNAKPTVAAPAQTLRSIDQLAPQQAVVNRRIKFSVGASLKNGVDFLVNNAMHHHDEAVRVGELQVWEVSNTSLMDHPFHLHGFFFQVLEVNGVPPAYQAWKDTINLAPRSKVKIAWMPDNRPGRWMYHCHILEHHEAGMMSHFSIVAPGSAIVDNAPACPH